MVNTRVQPMLIVIDEYERDEENPLGQNKRLRGDRH
jgi:hypothetical protein